MQTLINYANTVVIIAVCYSLFFMVYGFIAYYLIRFIAKLLIYAWTTIKTDWRTWRSNKDNDGSPDDNL